MKQYIFIILIISTFFLNANLIANPFSQYVQSVKNICPNLQSLLIKKSLFEIKDRSNACSETFTKKLLNDCSKLSCSQLKDLYVNEFVSRKGTVVGE
jgi:hypothetical protein